MQFEITFKNFGKLRKDKQERRNHYLMEWLVSTHSMAFRGFTTRSSGVLYILDIEETMVGWSIQKLQELSQLHGFSFQEKVHIDFLPDCIGWMTVSED